MGIFVRVVLYRLMGVSGKYHISDTWMWEKYNNNSINTNNTNNSNSNMGNNNNEDDKIA